MIGLGFIWGIGVGGLRMSGRGLNGGGVGIKEVVEEDVVGEECEVGGLEEEEEVEEMVVEGGVVVEDIEEGEKSKGDRVLLRL